MPYDARKPQLAPSAGELRQRIPGWGADLGEEHRRTWQELEDYGPTGAHWTMPERQGDDPRRERSIEHLHLPAVYGTAQPLHGLSGWIRSVSYRRFGEGRLAHWMLLILADRVEAVGAHLRSAATAQPDNPVTQTGVLSEPRYRPLRSRFGRGRVDVRHTWMDPFIVAGPWLLPLVLLVRARRGPGGGGRS